MKSCLRWLDSRLGPLLVPPNYNQATPNSCVIFPFGAHLSTTCLTAAMDMDDLRLFLTSHYALLAAVVVGLFGVLFALCFSRKPGHVKSQGEGKLEQSVGEESGGEQEEDSGQKHHKQQTRVRGVKPKAVRRITLPSHPLLAGEFKGHTGAVLSLDFDINGKYLGSCSEGAQHRTCSKLINLLVH